MFFRYVDDPFHLLVPNGFLATSAIPGVATSNTTDGSTNWLGHATYVINSNNVVEGGFANRQNWVTSQAVGSLTQANSPDIRPTLPYTATLGQVPSLGIFSSTYAVTSPYNERDPLTQIFANDTSTLGRHTLQFGFNLEYQQSGGTNAQANSGKFSFSPGVLPAGGATKFDQAFANFLQGSVSTFAQDSISTASFPHANIYEAYAQDDFHASARLTLNGGVRYSYFAIPSSGTLHGYPLLPIVNFDPATYNPANAPAIDTSGLICTAAPCAGGSAPNPNYDPQNGLIIPGMNSPYGSKPTSQPELTFAPRVGFALDVHGNGRLALRGGYGIYFVEVPQTLFHAMANGNFPNVLHTTISNTTFANPASGVTRKSPVPVTAVQPNTSAPYVQAYSLDLQQQIGPNSVLDIGYYGNRALHQGAAIELNQPIPGAYVQAGIIPGNVLTAGNSQRLNQIRPYGGYASIASTQPIFSSNYNSLQASFTRRVRNGTIFSLHYTFSKSLSNIGTPQNIYNIAAEYGPTPQDRTNIFNASFVYPLPFYRGEQGLTGHLLGGWETSGIVSYGSGQFSTATTPSVDPGGLGILDGPAAARPDYVSNPNVGAPHSVQQWFNTNAFATVPATQYRPGNDGTSNILGPGYGNWDLSVFKNVRFERSLNLQIRAEAFNVFNHVNYANIATALGQTNYGQVTSAGPARVLQLAAKVRF